MSFDRTCLGCGQPFKTSLPERALCIACTPLGEHDFDVGMGRELKDRGMNRVKQGLKDEHKKIIETAIRVVADRGEGFTTDEVYVESVRVVRERGIDPPSEWRALGPAVSNNDYIRATGEWRESKLPQCHQRPKRVWIKK